VRSCGRSAKRIPPWLSNLRTSIGAAITFGNNGVMMPAKGLEALRGKDAILFGSAGDPAIPDHVTLWGTAPEDLPGLGPIRKRPAHPNSAGNRCAAEHAVVPRIWTGSWCARIPRVNIQAWAAACIKGIPSKPATDVSILTRAGVERIFRFAFRLAQSRPRKLLTVITKSNAQRHAMVMWVRDCLANRRGISTGCLGQELVDAATARMVNRPASLDTIVATNLHADILSDLAAALAGSLGIAPTGNIDPERRFPSMFEPIHGSAFDIVGKGLANPLGTFGQW